MRRGDDSFCLPCLTRENFFYATQMLRCIDAERGLKRHFKRGKFLPMRERDVNKVAEIVFFLFVFTTDFSDIVPEPFRLKNKKERVDFLSFLFFRFGAVRCFFVCDNRSPVCAPDKASVRI